MNDVDRLRGFIGSYVDNVLDGLTYRANQKVRESWYTGEVSSVLNGLLGRQASLTIKLAQSPTNWDGHLAPLVLRSMIDCHISFEWILKSPKSRSQEYIGYALGQAKLSLANLEEKLEEKPDDKDIQSLVEVKRSWIAHHRLMQFVEVNLGSWSGSSVRKMAQEIDDEDFYKFSFTPFSACLHNTWEHVHLYNTIPCNNPLHKFHELPAMIDAPLDPDFLYRSAKYVSMSYRAYDRATGISGGPELPREFFWNHVGDAFDPISEEDFRAAEDDLGAPNA